MQMGQDGDSVAKTRVESVHIQVSELANARGMLMNGRGEKGMLDLYIVR